MSASIYNSEISYGSFLSVTDLQGERGLCGNVGPQGQKGDRGPQGTKGLQGLPGPVGTDVRVLIVQYL